MNVPPAPSPADVTVLLRAWTDGDDEAREHLIALVHRELRRLARRAMKGEQRDQTLQPTALVHEVYLRLVDLRKIEWTDRAHFYALAARLMRHILVDAARARRNLKRGGAVRKIPLVEGVVSAQRLEADLEALDDALQRLAAIDPRRSQVVELRFFGGLDVDETAAVLKVSRRTVLRDWTLARAWLFQTLSDV